MLLRADCYIMCAPAGVAANQSRIRDHDRTTPTSGALRIRRLQTVKLRRARSTNHVRNQTTPSIGRGQQGRGGGWGRDGVRRVKDVRGRNSAAVPLLQVVLFMFPQTARCGASYTPGSSIKANIHANSSVEGQRQQPQQYKRAAPPP